MKRISVLLLLTLVIYGCATFKGEIPVEGTFPEILYISPKNQDGIQDAVKIPLTIPVLEGLTVTGYYLSITDADAAVFYSSGTPKGTTRTTKRITLPQEIFWDGKNNKGEWVADGVYLLTAEVWDANNNTGKTPALQIVVDNTPPAAAVALPYNTFSPNGDGKQDVLQIMQSGSSVEENWNGSFADAKGNVIRKINWKGLAANFTWDGKNDTAVTAGEGIYTYTLTSTDQAGNTFIQKNNDIRIDNRVYPINIKLPGTAFSPNGDNVKDTIRFQLEADNPAGISSSNITIIDKAGKVLVTLSLTNPLPAFYDYDGKREKTILPDGQYFARFAVVYANGAAPVVVSPAFTLDTKAPTAVFSRQSLVFSPDGDNRKDTLTIFQTSSDETSWSGEVQNPAGDVVKNYTWGTRAIAFSWDGKDNAGNVVADGVYNYVLSTTDEAGNAFKSTISGIQVDTRPTPVAVKIPKIEFSPNNDGVDDNITINPDYIVKEGIVNWKLGIENSSGVLVKTYEGTASDMIPESFTWNGEDKDGLVKEGKYQVAFAVEYEKGNLGSTITKSTFTLDVSPPTVLVDISPLPFSPDNDGENDKLTIKVNVSDPSGVRQWSAVIYDPAEHAFMDLPSAQFKNNVFTWDGKSKSGELVQSASDYVFAVTAIDKLGNKSVNKTSIPVDILVIKDGDRLKISISSIYFKAYTADYLSIDPVLVTKNQTTLNKLAVILQKYNNYNIKLEGHAVREYWNNAKRWQTEEKDELLPLSTKRAEVIRDALIQRGIENSRMSVAGYGGYQPIIPHSDLINRWKNRRVEFILIKK